MKADPDVPDARQARRGRLVSAPEPWSPPIDTTWFCIRRDGGVRQAGWTDAPLAHLRDHIGARPDETVEACLSWNFRPVPVEAFGRVFNTASRGLLGVEFACSGVALRLAPTRMLATNTGFDRALARFLSDWNIDRAVFEAEGQLRAFDAEQYLLPPDGRRIRLLRGSPVIEPATGRLEATASLLADGISDWMLRNLSPDGALPYKYWPSPREDSRADNAIRRFLAVLALARFGALRRSETFRAAARRNLRHNIGRYFQPLGDGMGAIVEGNEAKLGAAALAALAIIETSAEDEFGTELSLLAAGISSLADDRAGFRTFFFPAERDGQNWNFYSGEALLFWAEAARRNHPVAPSLDRCARAFELCRDRHRERRNPAFVPWATQACAALYARTGDRPYADFIIEMSDWLQSMQQWDDVEADLRGRFHDPARPEFGVPHASSTGVYLEGYAPALALVRALGDEERAGLYERIVERGLRSLRQLQFRDERDMFYIAHPERVKGALRTETCNNELRVDSAAHALLAAVTLLRPIDFSAHAPPGKPSGLLDRLRQRYSRRRSPFRRRRNAAEP